MVIKVRQLRHLKELNLDIKFNQETFDIELKVSPDGFFEIETTKTQSEKLQQRLFLRLKTYPRDLFWNTRYGIDYLNTVFGKNRPKSSVDVVLRNEIMKEPMVQSIEHFESYIQNYSYACEFTVKLRYEEEITTFFILTNENGVTLTNQDGDRLVALL